MKHLRALKLKSLQERRLPDGGYAADADLKEFNDAMKKAIARL